MLTAIEPIQMKDVILNRHGQHQFYDCHHDDGERYATACVDRIGTAALLHINVERFTPSIYRVMKKDFWDLIRELRDKGVTEVYLIKDGIDYKWAKFVRGLGAPLPKCSMTSMIDTREVP